VKELLSARVKLQLSYRYL